MKIAIRKENDYEERKWRIPKIVNLEVFKNQLRSQTYAKEAKDNQQQYKRIQKFHNFYPD